MPAVLLLTSPQTNAATQVYPHVLRLVRNAAGLEVSDSEDALQPPGKNTKPARVSDVAAEVADALLPPTT